MSTPVITPPPAEQKPDIQAHLEARNRAEHAQRSGKAPETPAIKAVEPETPKPGLPAPPAAQPRMSRSERRAMNHLREELGQLKGRLAAYEEMGVKPKAAEAAPAAADDPEPLRAAFQTDLEYARAVSKWDARQETRKEIGRRDESQQSNNQLEEYRQHLKAMDQKAVEDKKNFPDWDAVAAASAEDDHKIEFEPDKHPVLMGMIARSDVKASVLYHFAKNPELLEDMLDLAGKPADLIRKFHQLEGKLEGLYSKDEKKAAQAGAEKPPEDREHLAEAKPAGRTVAERDALKPRPSAEVAARGGSAPPEEPPIGSKDWMARRNQVQFGR